jgi:alpha-tubulin suppressor-like RCC1 family protein
VYLFTGYNSPTFQLKQSGMENLIACGADHNAVVTFEGLVVCWGATEVDKCSVPSELAEVIAVACGDYHMMALTQDGKVVCWGQNNSGQCDVPPDLEVIAISTGYCHNVALMESGAVRCWGGNDEGQCDVPLDIVVRCGDHHCAAVAEAGRVICGE